MSSMNTDTFFPAAGPYMNFVRFSIIPSMALCTSTDLVRYEKFKLSLTYMA